MVLFVFYWKRKLIVTSLNTFKILDNMYIKYLRYDILEYDNHR